jgi:hypothetical protein
MPKYYRVKVFCLSIPGILEYPVTILGLMSLAKGLACLKVGKAWFYGTLLPAALCETWAHKVRFSPVQIHPSAETEKEGIHLSGGRNRGLTSFPLMVSPHTFQGLSFAFADSQRQRVPALFRLHGPHPGRLVLPTA